MDTARPPYRSARSYDKDLILTETITICFYYLGPGKRQGVRSIWRCPECGKDDKFAAHATKNICGCLNAACQMPQTMNPLAFIAYKENLELQGPQFLSVLQKGYDILNLEHPPGPSDQEPPKRTSSRQDASRHETSDPVPSERTSSGHESSTYEPSTSSFTRAGAAPPPWDIHEPEAPPVSDPVAEEYEIIPDAEAEPSFSSAGDDDSIIVVEAIEEPEDSDEDGGRAYGGRAYGGNETAARGPREIQDHDAASNGAAPGRRLRAEPLKAHRTHATGLTADAEVFAYYEEPDYTIDGDLLDAVYTEILESCPLLDSHREYLKTRGLSAMTAHRARIGSMTRARARTVKNQLLKKFSEDDLLRVPGFSRHALGRLSFTLSGEYLLIPYHDADHNLTTLEGRVIGSPRTGGQKYVSLRGSGSHLYVFPEFMPDHLEAFCEGVLGAIVAAQSGIAVGSIQGVKRHRDSQTGGPLKELSGVDFSGRRIPYIPDVDVKPESIADVKAEIPKACHNLIATQNGVPQIALLPEGKDLDEWLLKNKPSERRPAFTSLVTGAVSLKRHLQDNDGLDRDPGQGSGKAPEHSPEQITTRIETTTREETTTGPQTPKHLATASTPGPLYEARDKQRDEQQQQPKEEPKEKRYQDREDPHDGKQAASLRETLPQARQAKTPAVSAASSASSASSASTSAQDPTPTIAKAFGALVKMASLQQRDIDLLERLGIPEEVAREAGVGSMSRVRAEEIAARLASRIGAEALLGLDGFADANSGRLVLDMAGDYCLIPHRDNRGNITAIQAVPVSYDTDGPCVDPERKALIRGLPGDHLYVPAGQSERLEVITTSALEALRLCACGIRAGSIRKAGAYSPAAGQQAMAELADVDFGGRKILYAPLVGNPPSQNIINGAPQAMRTLIARHNGTPALLTDQQENRPLGEFLISLPAWDRRERFERLLADAQMFAHLATTNKGHLDSEHRDSEHRDSTRPALPGRTNESPRTQARLAESTAEAEDESFTREPQVQAATPENRPAPPIPVPRPGYRSPSPPKPKDARFTQEEVVSGLVAASLCILVPLAGLTLWHLPSGLLGSLYTVFGEPAKDRAVEGVPLAVATTGAIVGALSQAVSASISSALYYGSALSFVVAPYVVHRRKVRRVNLLMVLGVMPPTKRHLRRFGLG